MFKSILLNLINKRDIRHKVKYESDDISKIYILPSELQNHIKVRATSPSADVLEGMNSYEYKLILKKTRVNHGLKRIPTDNEVLQTKSLLRDEIEKMYKKNRKTRQQTEKIGLEVDVKLPKPIVSPNSNPTLLELKMQAKKAREKRELKNNVK